MRVVRSAEVLVALLGVCSVCAVHADAVYADTPVTPPATVVPTAPAATPAAANAATAAAKPPGTVPADPAQAAAEKRLMAAGYKPEMRNGTKYWCRSETPVGSHLAGHKVCATADQIDGSAHDSQQFTEQAQRRQANPSGH